MADEAPCPRCARPLKHVDYAGVPVQTCEGCGGLTLELRHNVPLLERLSADLEGQVDLHGPIDPWPDQGGDVSCPGCGQTMANFGYMGTNTVYLDRCSGCMRLWIDGDELPTLVTLFARTQSRGQARRRELDEEAKGLARRVSALLMTRARSDRMMF